MASSFPNSRYKPGLSEIARHKSQLIRDSMLAISEAKVSSSSPYPIHLAFGHEDLAACSSLVRQPSDRFVLTHRNIHFNLALSPKDAHPSLIDEALVKPSGINRGQFGCMTMRNISAGVAYCSSILANNIPVGVGIASTLESGSVCWIQTGDGAIEEGCFYESLVFARARDLPCLFLVENNNWSLGTSIKERRMPIQLNLLAHSLGLQYFSISTQESLDSTIDLLERARSAAELAPVIVEASLITQGGTLDPQRGYVSYHHGPIKMYPL